MSDHERLIQAARESIKNPPYGPTLASSAFTLGLLTAAEIVRGRL